MTKLTCSGVLATRFGTVRPHQLDCVDGSVRTVAASDGQLASALNTSVIPEVFFNGKWYANAFAGGIALELCGRPQPGLCVWVPGTHAF